MWIERNYLDKNHIVPQSGRGQLTHCCIMTMWSYVEKPAVVELADMTNASSVIIEAILTDQLPWPLHKYFRAVILLMIIRMHKDCFGASIDTP